jgi:hypothetical protein
MIKISFSSKFPEIDQTILCYDPLTWSFEDIKLHYGKSYNNIKYIFCNECNLTELPELPTNLVTLFCCWNKLKSLPKLPSTLKDLYCSSNEFTVFPKLPEGLHSFSGGNNNYGRVEGLPKSLFSLSIHNSKIDHIDDLQELTNLVHFTCFRCNLTKLPNLPNSLQLLICCNNFLTELPELSNNLITLYTNDNKLTEIKFTKNMSSLDCSNNKLVSMPSIPYSLEYIKFGGNPFHDPILIRKAKIIIGGTHHLKCVNKSDMYCMSRGNELDTSPERRMSKRIKHTHNI